MLIKEEGEGKRGRRVNCVAFGVVCVLHCVLRCVFVLCVAFRVCVVCLRCVLCAYGVLHVCVVCVWCCVCLVLCVFGVVCVWCCVCLVFCE
jgi:hypothetical protein